MLKDRFFKYTNKTDYCWEWIGLKAPNGYGRIGIGGRKGGMEYAHRASWIIHNGPIEKGKFVCHKCDNTSCVNPHHLFIGNAKENTLDRLSKNRRFPSVLRESAKLSLAKVFLIKKIYPLMSITDFSRMFKVSRNCIWQVLKDKSWKSNHGEYICQRI